ncbi:MAG TPA: alpha/beta fold hydrolase [Kofleriaceae bacterium]|jgi:triacylglycerol lipase|nr:alpha/beta fold hydrolase [Kofleriaceae bacterium]
MLKTLSILAGVLAMQACATSDGSSADKIQAGVAPTKPSADGSRVGFILAHGLGGSVDSFDPAIVTALQADGFYVLRDAVPPVDSVANRATSLAGQVDGFISANKLDQVHIIAHSMGGLDSRYLISTLGYADKITSLTTLGTPHRGSPIADIALGISDDLSTSVEDALLALTNVIGSGVDSEHLDLALTDLAEANAPAFNAANPDAAGVTYNSYAGYSTLWGIPNFNADALCSASGVKTPDPSSLPGELQLTGPIIGGLAFRPHDGVVPIDSASWTGFLGCIPTDHLDMTRAGEKDASDLDIDLVPFYRQVAARVAGVSPGR